MPQRVHTACDLSNNKKRYPMRFPKLILALIAMTSLAACSTPGPYDDLSAQRYINRVASSDTFEIMAGQMALQRATDPEARAFAQQQIALHTATSQQLITELAGRRDQTVAVPVPGLMLPEHREALARLQTTTMFDRDYVASQVMAHEQAVALNETFAEDSNNDLLVKHAKSILPDTRASLDAINRINARMMQQPAMVAPAMAPAMQPVIVQ